MAKNIKLTENNAKKSPQGGVLVGKKDGQTIIYDDGKVGGWFVGKTHKEGGIQGIDKTSGQPIEVQTGEVIITAPALADQTPREFQGKMLTNRQILSKINSDAGGVAFAEDGMEIPSKILFKGSSYKYGDKMMSDKEIADEINKCGCDHDEKKHLSEGMSLEDIAKKHGVTLEELDKQVEIGMEDESIHAGDYKDHFNIVKDHLVESPTFYTDENAKGQNENFLKRGLIAPNGEQSNLNALQYKLVRTSEFKEWFGDWENDKENSSKILDSNGEPLIVYHGTKNEFYKFDTDKQLRGWLGKGFYFSKNKIEAKDYGKRLLKCFLNIKNPFVIQGDEVNEDGTINWGLGREGEIAKKYGSVDASDISTTLKEYKNDGIIEGDMISCFYSNQIKIADGTNKTFDSNNDDIRFKHGGEMKKENLVKDAKDGNTPARDLNNYNDMLDVQADGQVGGDSGIYKDGGGIGKVITPIVSNWNDVPSTWKNTTKVKKVTWANNPYDKGLYSIVTPFLGHDEYRPVFDGINFDKNGITCTDAHKLITLPYPNKEYEGVYNADLSKKKVGEQVKIDGKYPNYLEIIPKSKDSYGYYIDVYKLLQYTNVAIKYSNNVTKAVNYKINDVVMGFNGKFLIEVLNTLLKLGYDKVYSFYQSPTRALTFSPAKQYEIGNDDLLLIMPVMVNGEKYLGAKDLDYTRELSVYYDFNDNEIHNADGSVAEFKMTYESNLALSPEDVKPFENMIRKSKNRIPILDYVLVQNGIARTSNLDSEFELKEVNLPDGIYKANNGTLEISIEAIEDYPVKPIFEVDDNTIEFVMPSVVLEYYVNKFKLVVGKDELRPVMMGICLHHTPDNKLFLVGTDANILLKVDITQYVDMPIYNKDLKTIIQPNYLYDYLNAIEESALTIKSNKIATKIDSDKWSFYCKNIDGNFPNYDAIIPRENNKLLSLELNELRNCINSDFAKKYVSESDNKDKIFVFNNEHEIFIATYDQYGRGDNKDKVQNIEKLCNANISVKEQEYYYNDGSILLTMPTYTSNEKSNFSFRKKILERVISIVSDKNLEMHFSEINRPYLTPINSFDYKKTTKEHKVKEQPAKLKEVKKQKENSEKTELLEAIETLNMLGELEQDKKERKEIYEALDVLNMIKESNNYENGGMLKRNFSFTPIQTPLN